MKAVAGLIIAAMCSGCANQALVQRMDRAEQSLSTVAKNEAYFNSMLKEQARIQTQLDTALRRLEMLQVGGARELEEVRALAQDSAVITKRLEIRRVGDASLLWVRD